MGSEEYEKQHQENEENVQKDKSKDRSLMCGKLSHYPNEYKNDKDSSGDEKHVTFAMMCYEKSEEDKNGNGDDENKQESENPDDDERNVDAGTARLLKNPKKPH